MRAAPSAERHGAPRAARRASQQTAREQRAARGAVKYIYIYFKRHDEIKCEILKTVMSLSG